MFKLTIILTLLIGIAYAGRRPRRPIRPPTPIGAAGVSAKSNIYKDIVFVLDTSGSIGKSDFNIMLTKCKEIVEDHDVGIHATLFGLDIFSDNAITVIRIDEYINKPELLQAITHVEYKGGMTNTFKALNRLVDHSFTYDNGHVSYAKKIAIVMTDGKSQAKQKTINAAKKAKNSGIEVTAIGIGDGIDWEEIIAISSGGAAKGAAFKLPSFTALRDFNVNKLALVRP